MHWNYLFTCLFLLGAGTFVIDTAHHLAHCLKNIHINGMDYSLKQNYIIFYRKFLQNYILQLQKQENKIIKLSLSTLFTKLTAPFEGIRR